MVDSILRAGLSGMQTGMQNAARDAERISNSYNPTAPEESTDPVEPMVSLKLDEHQVEASGKVIQVGKRLINAVLDILA